MVREKCLDILAEEKLKIIEELSSLPKPDWITEESRKMYGSYKTLREQILVNKSKWSFFDYNCHFAHHYYNIALLYYTYFYKYKVNFNIIKISIEKCLSKLSGIRSTHHEKTKTEDLFSKVNTFKEAMDKIYIKLNNGLYTEDNIKEIKTLINLGQIDENNLDMFKENLPRFGTYILGVLLINFISEFEEVLSLHIDKDHFSKFNICKCLARVYQICGQQTLFNDYMKRASGQLKLAFKNFGKEDNCPAIKKQIRIILKEQLEQYSDLPDIFEIIKGDYTCELSSLECQYIERKYIKYCTNEMFTEIRNTLQQMSRSNNKNIFQRLMTNSEQVKTLENIYEDFKFGQYYKLLMQHKKILTTKDQKESVKRYKKECKYIISVKLNEQQRELDVLKQLVMFLRSISDHRKVINDLQLTQFCNNTIVLKEFFSNIFNLQYADNQELFKLKNLTGLITNQTTLFFHEKFREILQNYSFPPIPDITDGVMTLNGKLIIFSEVIENVLSKKTEDIKELRIVGADILLIDESLDFSDWFGVNIVIVAKTINIQGKQIWNVSGKNAENFFETGLDGIPPEQDGENGKNGHAGQSGGNVYISCNNFINSDNLTIISNGGNGGNGQDGGNGACGKNGIGVQLSEFENLTNPYKPSKMITEKLVKKLSATYEMISGNSAKFDLVKLLEKERKCPNMPLPKIANKMVIFDINWRTSLARLNLWDAAPCYLKGKDEEKREIIYSYYPARIPFNEEIMILYQGTNASVGGRGGKGGKKGSGGYPGNIEIKCNHMNINIENNFGLDGKKGLDGQIGKPGKNGWDMGYILVNRFIKPTKKLIGQNQNCKLTLRYHTERYGDNFVYCPYRDEEENYSDHYVEIRERESVTSVYNRNVNVKETNNEQGQNKAIRAKAINRKVISEYETAIDVVDELSHLILELEEVKEQVLEEDIEEDEEKETEITNFQVKRQAIFDYSFMSTKQKMIRKKPKTSKPETHEFVQKLLENPSNIKFWFELKNNTVDLENLVKLFRELFNRKDEFKDRFSEIYIILLNKYKIITCQKIKEINKCPQLNLFNTPTPIEKYLIFDSKFKEIAHNDLGFLHEYFQENHQHRLQHLQDYLTRKKIACGHILYPLKFFIMEEMYKAQEYEIDFQDVLNKLNDLENRLERLAQCYQVAYEEKPCSGIFYYIEKRKDEILKKLENEVNCKKLYKNFAEYIGTVGMTSTAVRELLACAFNVNIKIFILVKGEKLTQYHDHNPTAKEIYYLFLENDKYIDFRFNDLFANLHSERKMLSKNYSNILNFIDKCICKQDCDEFVKKYENLNKYETENNGNIYLSYRKFSDEDLLQKICAYFLPNEKSTVFLALKKLKSKYIGSKVILFALLQKFEIEGLHVSCYEVLYIINTILKSFVQDSCDLEIFQWMISVEPQNVWINKCFYLELENYFKMSLASTSISQYLINIKQKCIILLMDKKLREAIDTINLKNITICLEVLNQIEIDEDILQSVPLSKWHYILRQQHLEFKLANITIWKNNDQFSKSLYYLNCIESNIGSTLINEFLNSLQEKKEEVTPNLCLELFSLLYREEWTLNFQLINNIQKFGVQHVKEDIQKIQESIDQERDLKTLLELIKDNSHTSKTIKKELNSLANNSCLHLNVHELHSEEIIRDWSIRFKEDIQKLKEKDKKMFIAKNSDKILEMITHAIKLKKGFLLRITQRLAIVLMLVHNINILAQISTGEGKSLIVVAISIFKALCGEKVDIITSSSVLAIRDASIHSNIFAIFDINVSHNCSEKLDERRDAYSSSPVIFGDLSNFQRDFLLDRFYGKNILGDRNFETLIVDEVDNMLLDKGNNTLYLSHEIPGLDKLESVYLFLWKRIAMNVGRKYENFEIILKQNVLYDLYGTLSTEDLENNLQISKTDSVKIYNWLKEVKVLNHSQHVLKKLTEADMLKINSKYSTYTYKIQYVIEKTLNRVREIKIPRYLYKFVELHLDMWIKNGLLAAFMEEGHDYVVDVDRTQTKVDINPNITIIDKGTGTDQSNSQWEEALHQFLQLKHGCKISTQTLKAVFLSNVSYFKKYDKLYGLTGTLGTQVERDLLKKLYNVKFVNIPTVKRKKFIEEEAILCPTEIDWQFRIIARTKELIKEDRSVLIICETIKEVNTLDKAFQQANTSIKIYKREYEECLLAQGKEELQEGHVIIATNLAGRGTDIKITQKLNENGGLHILLTYLPNNIRIEQQAFGRAARSGYNGSGQLVIIGHGSYIDKIEERENQERQRIAEMETFFRTRIEIEETFFDSFTDIYKNCKKQNMDQKLKDIALQRCLDRWAFWIDEFGGNMCEPKTQTSFEQFKSHLEQNFTIWENWNDDPIQCIKFGLHYIKEKKYNEAIKVFNNIIKKEPEFCEAAHYYKAAALSMNLDFEKRPFKGTYLQMYEEFINELRMAEKLFEARKDFCMNGSVFIENLKENMKNSFMIIDAYKKQQESLISLYSYFIQSINNIVGYSVTKDSFITQEINEKKSEEIYCALLEKSVLKHSHIKKPNTEDLNELSNSFGLPQNIIQDFLKLHEKTNIQEESFLKELQQQIKMPNLEHCWELLLKENKLMNENKLVIIPKSKLIIDEKEILNNLHQFNINLQKNNGKFICMKQFIDSSSEDYFIIEEKEIKNSQIFKKLKKENLIIFNRIAEFQCNKILEPIEEYDSINLENLIADGICKSEAEKILDILIKKEILKKKSDFYILAINYDENKLPKIPPYDNSLLQIFRINFAYRIALENIKNDLNSSENQVYLKLMSQPHVSLMWELTEKKIIEPVKICNHKSENISEIVINYCNNKKEKESILNSIQEIIKKIAGSLKSLDTPSFVLQYIVENSEDLPSSSPQELNNFMNNSLDFILRTEEKKYTLKMIYNTLFVTILGILEIAAGLAIQLYSTGVLSYFGDVLINEGCSDLMYACNCWISAYFDWSNYFQYKMRSMLQSLISFFSSLRAAKGAKFSIFGNKLAMKGVVNESGKEIVNLVGKELINEVGGMAVAKEFGKKFIVKVGEGVAKGMMVEGNSKLIESHLQTLCNELANHLIKDVEDAVNEHSIKKRLYECYKVLGPDYSKSRILYHTEKSLTKPSANSAVIAKTMEIYNSISSISSVAAKEINTMPYSQYLCYLGNALSFAQYVSHLTDIRTSVSRMLDRVDEEITNDIEKALHERRRRYNTSNETEIDNFVDDVIGQWRNILREDANNIFNNKIFRPIMQQCTFAMAKSAIVLYNYQRNKYHRYIFTKAKEQKNQQLANHGLAEQTHQEIIANYHDTLTDLKARVRDPDLYADIVMEKGHIDGVCLKATSFVLNEIKNDDKPIKIKVITENGASIEFCTLGDGESKEINLNLKNQHFTSLTMNDKHNPNDYECFYRCLVNELPELNEISMEEFRTKLSNEIKLNTEIHNDILDGKHAVTIRKKMYGGYKSIDIATDKLYEGLKTGKYFLSQSSVSERTSDRQNSPGIHLADLAEKMKDKYEGEPVNVVQTGKSYVFLDNRRVVAASTINNPNVKILAREFKYDEILPTNLQKQYSVNDNIVNTAGRAAEVRIQRSTSFGEKMPIRKPYSPAEVRIRRAFPQKQATVETINMKKNFFKRAKDVGFRKYVRSRSVERLS